jgi:DNA processing protein
MKEQLVLSQFPHGYHVQPKNFPIRNRTMALISHATIIVEAAEKSGSLHQGWEALRLGRPLFMLDETIRDESLTWPREFQKYGAQVMAPTQTEELFFDYLPEPGRGESRELAL